MSLFQPRLSPQEGTDIPTWISWTYFDVYACIMFIHVQICLLSDFITSGNRELLFRSHYAIDLRRGQQERFSRHLSLSWASSIQFIPPHPTSWRSFLILSSPIPSFTLRKNEGKAAPGHGMIFHGKEGKGVAPLLLTLVTVQGEWWAELPGESSPLPTQYDGVWRHRQSTRSKEQQYFLSPPINKLTIVQLLAVNVARLQFFSDVTLCHCDCSYRRFEEA